MGDRNEPTWMMKTTADLYSSQLTVKSHSTRGIGGDFAGILLSTLAAAIYNTNVQNQAFWLHSSGDQWLLQTAEVHIPAESWQTNLQGKNVYKRNGGKGESMLKEKLGQNASVTQGLLATSSILKILM